MTPKKIENDLRNLQQLLLDNDTVIATNPIAVNKVGDAVRVTWKSPAVSSVAGDGQFGSLANYRSLVRDQAYTVVLFDGSLLQISYDFKGQDLVGHRLCYHPCPFELPSEELRNEPLADLLDVYMLHGLSSLRLRAPIRFDFDPKNASFGHPAVHVHLMRGRCRCPVVAPLGLGHFLHFVFSHFYPELWSTLDFLRDWPLQLWNRTILPVEEGQLHLSCLRV